MKTNKEFLDELLLTYNNNSNFTSDLFMYLNNHFPLIDSPKSKYNHEIKKELIDAFIEKTPLLKDKENDASYLSKNLRFNDANRYSSNKYLNLLIDLKKENPTLPYSLDCIKPYEIFLSGDSYLQFDRNQYFVPLSFSNKAIVYPIFSFPNHRKQMLLPRVIDSTFLPLKVVRGKLLILGLRDGYFTYMSSLSEKVKEITVADSDQEVTNFFEKYIFPKCQNKIKIKIINKDAYDFLDEVKDQDYDYIFSNIWTNAFTGVTKYLKLKSRLDSFKFTKCIYFMEESIITELGKSTTSAILSGSESPYYNQLKEYKFESIYDYRKVFTFHGLLDFFKK